MVGKKNAAHTETVIAKIAGTRTALRGSGGARECDNPDIVV
jgi:hypothetical protein